jgi:transposase
VALEAGAQSAWISRELEKLGHEVIVANARQLKWITASDQKSDRTDAEKLARLARADRALLAPIEHRTAEQQAELAVIRARDALVRARTLLVNAARGIAKNFGHRLPKTMTATFGERACALCPNPYSRLCPVSSARSASWESASPATKKPSPPWRHAIPRWSASPAFQA